MVCSGISVVSAIGDPTTFYVDPSSGDDANPGTAASPFKTIEKAVDVASSGNTIRFIDNSYFDDDTEEFPVVITKNLTIAGNDSAINASGQSGSFNAITVLNCSVTISDLTVTGANGYNDCDQIDVADRYFGNGILAYNSSLTLNNVACNCNDSNGLYYVAEAYAGTLSLTDFSANGNDGNGLNVRAFDGGSADVDIDGATCEDNYKGLSFNGGYAYGMTTNVTGDLDITISDATCTGNDHGFFIKSYGSDTKLSVSDSNFNDNSRHGFVLNLAYGTADISISECTFGFIDGIDDYHGNYHGLFISSYYSTVDTSIEDSTFEGNSHHGINTWIYECDTFNLEIDGCFVQNNQYHGIRINVDECAPSISITDTTVSENGNNGCYFDIDDAESNIAIDSSSFFGNGSNGLYLEDDDSKTILAVDSSSCNENVKNGYVIKSDECYEAIYTIADSEAKGNGNNGLLYVGYDGTDAELVLENNVFSGNGALVVAPVFTGIDSAPVEDREKSCSNPHSESGSCMEKETSSEPQLDGKRDPHVSNAGAYITSINDSFLGILFKNNVFAGNAGPGCAFNTGFNNEDGDEVDPGEILDLGLYYFDNALFGNGGGDTFVDEGCGICTLNGSDASVVSMQPIATLLFARANAQFAIAQGNLPDQPTGEMAALLDSINQLMSGAFLSPNYIFASGQAYQALEFIAQLQGLLA